MRARELKPRYPAREPQEAVSRPMRARELKRLGVVAAGRLILVAPHAGA